MKSQRMFVVASAIALALTLLPGCSAKPAAAPLTNGSLEASSAPAASVPVTSTQPSDGIESTAPVAVPNVRGKSADEATRLLRSAGFGVKQLNRPNAAKKGTVAVQSPAANTFAPPATKVTITVSTGVETPSDSEILAAFKKTYLHGFSGALPTAKVEWKGRDNRGVWWAAVMLVTHGPSPDGYAICGYRTSRNTWVIQTIGNPDGSVLVSGDAPPMPPSEIVTAMERHGVPVMAP